MVAPMTFHQKCPPDLRYKGGPPRIYPRDVNFGASLIIHINDHPILMERDRLMIVSREIKSKAYRVHFQANCKYVSMAKIFLQA